MIIYPDTAEEKLGFDVLRESIGSYLLSPMGQEHFVLQKPSSDGDWIKEEIQRVVALKEVLQFDDPVPLYGVEDVREGLRRIIPTGSVAEVELLLHTMRVLQAFRRIKGYFDQRKEQYPGLYEITKELGAFPDIEKRIAEIVDDDGRIKDSASSELRQIRRKMVSTQTRLRETLMNELRRSIGQGYTTEAQPTMRSGRMVIPVRVEAKRKIDGFVHDVSSTGQTVYIEPAKCLDLNNEVRTLEAAEHHEVRRILIDIASRIREHIPTIVRSCEVFGQIDVIQAKAKLADRLNAHATSVNDEGRIQLSKARNPVLQLHFDAQNKRDGTERQVTPLEISLGEDWNTLLLTGPNAGGKTVAMKTLGLFSLMISLGIPLPADEKSEFCLFDTLIVDIGDEQSIENDLSTFSSHVTNLRYMLDRASEKTLVLIDEAGTGTDPAEGAALAQVVLERLTELGAKTIATTHHGSLKVFAHEEEGIENGSMEFDQDTLRPTYRLQMGIPGSSYAFEIASRIGLETGLLDRARELLGDQKVRMEDLISSLEARNQALSKRLEDAEMALSDARVQRERYEGLFEKLEAEKDDIKQNALAEAESVMQRANAEIERTIREIKEHQAAKEKTKEVRAELESFKTQISKEKQKTASKKQKRSKKRSNQAKNEKGSVARKPLQVGDQVVLDGGSTTAELIELSGKHAVIMAGSMHMRVKIDRLRKVAGPRKQKVIVKQVKSSGDAGITALKARQRIDIRGKRVDEALSEIPRFIDDAITTNLNRIEIVHGKGTGALRNAIHEYLDTTPEIAHYEDAPYNEGGPGVTYAFLK